MGLGSAVTFIGVNLHIFNSAEVRTTNPVFFLVSRYLLNSENAFRWPCCYLRHILNIVHRKTDSKICVEVGKHRGSNMSASVLLNLLNELGKRDKMRGLPSILFLFRNDFNKFNNTRAHSIYHMTNTLKSDFWRKNIIILSLCTQRCYGRHNVSRKSINH